MRGTQCLEFGAGAGGGLIPTYAGNTWPLNRRYAQPRAHPHVCGEHPAFGRAAANAGGSSPRVWGALIDAANGYPVTRLIPTCVGSTRSIFGLPFEQRAHPHVCGEHTTHLDYSIRHCGSSPRVWGAPQQPYLPAGSQRLIPTCVGSTPAGITCRRASSAHPHVCGEHLWSSTWFRPRTGSSPRVWGARKKIEDLYEKERLIPTCVGSTL